MELSTLLWIKHVSPRKATYGATADPQTHGHKYALTYLSRDSALLEREESLFL